MGNFTQQSETGTPGITMKWPKNVIITTDVKKTDEGRFLCRIKVESGEFFNLPGTHPTKIDAERTLLAYIEENMS
jgi:hypothetical protein